MARFPFVSADNSPTSLMPRMPLTLMHDGQPLEVVGLLDTGSAVNVLPYPLGLALGAVWEEQTTVVPLVGSLGQFEARALVLMASHPQINLDEPVRTGIRLDTIRIRTCHFRSDELLSRIRCMLLSFTKYV